LPLAFTIAALTACRGNKPPPHAQSTTIEVADDAGDVVRLAAPADASSPSFERHETIIAIGAVDRIVGRTRYDVAGDRRDSVGRRDDRRASKRWWRYDRIS
jgi:hypothetical protein